MLPYCFCESLLETNYFIQPMVLRGMLQASNEEYEIYLTLAVDVASYYNYGRGAEAGGISFYIC